MIERRIKELSIACEALSRVAGMEAYFRAIQALLGEAIDEANKENHPPQSTSPINEDDKIPF